MKHFDSANAWHLARRQERLLILHSVIVVVVVLNKIVSNKITVKIRIV